MSRFLENLLIRNLVVLATAILVAVGSGYATYTVLMAFDADPVDVGALAKGSLAVLGTLLFCVVVFVMVGRATARSAAREPRA